MTECNENILLKIKFPKISQNVPEVSYSTEYGLEFHTIPCNRDF